MSVIELGDLIKKLCDLTKIKYLSRNDFSELEKKFQVAESILAMSKRNRVFGLARFSRMLAHL